MHWFIALLFLVVVSSLAAIVVQKVALATPTPEWVIQAEGIAGLVALVCGVVGYLAMGDPPVLEDTFY